MVLGSFQCWGCPTALAYSRAGLAVFIAGELFFVCSFISSILDSFSNASSLGTRLDMTEILWSWPL